MDTVTLQTTVPVLDHGSVRLVSYSGLDNDTIDADLTVFTFDVKAPIFVLAQWSDILVPQYKVSEHWYTPELLQISTRPAVEGFAGVVSPVSVIQSVISMQSRQAHEVYDVLVKKGCPAELARGVLPLNTYCYAYYSTNASSLVTFLRNALLSSKGVSHERSAYAEAILSIVRDLSPRWVSDFT